MYRNVHYNKWNFNIILPLFLMNGKNLVTTLVVTRIKNQTLISSQNSKYSFMNLSLDKTLVFFLQ